MAEIRFYHLQRTSEDAALPQIALKAWQAGHKIVVKCTDTDHVERLNNALWTFRPEVFLPHGSKADGAGVRQPVWLTDADDNPNGARTLIVGTGAVSEQVGAYDLSCIMLNGNEAAQVEAARSLWKVYKDAGHTVSYWQQGEQGWEKKA